MALLEMRGITKRFGSLVANDQIDLDVNANEIHALLGENGAGKSTLMKVLYGLYQPDAGEIRLEDKAVRLESPIQAIRSGIGFVAQHFSLVPTFTVAENVLLGFEGGEVLRRDEMNRKVEEAATRFGFNINPNALVRDLAVGQQQRVEILKALYRHCRVLILDEPTAVLTPKDAENLFEVLRHLREKHLSVIIIAHKLEEVMAISQRVTVLRLGKVAGRAVTAETTTQDLARMMVGRNVVSVTRNVDHHAGKDIALDVRGLRVTDQRGVSALRDLSLQVHVGEVVGIAGVAGNGQSELVASLCGTLTPDAGSVQVSGQAVTLGDPRSAHAARLARIPEDRLKGVVGQLTVAENLALESIDEFTVKGHLNHKAMDEQAVRLIKDFQIKAQPHDRVRTLSGGNMQKVILARTLARDPAVVLAAQPTRGLDVGATEYVHQKLLEQKHKGAGVLLISEDLDEVLSLSDRILVIHSGEIVGEFTAGAVDMDQLSLLMTGAKA